MTPATAAAGSGATPGHQPADELDGPARDRALMAAHVGGDPHAFAELVRLHQGRLWAVALRTLGDREEAADALQDALVSAFRAAATYRGEAAVTTWLHRVVVNACLDRVRRTKARPTVPLPETDVPLRRDEHGQTETRIDVVAALARIPEHQRTALVLVDMQDLPVAEAAAVLGVAVGTVKSRCARGRAALLEVLRADAAAGADAVGADAVGDHPATDSGDLGNQSGTPRVGPTTHPDTRTSVTRDPAPRVPRESGDPS